MSYRLIADIFSFWVGFSKIYIALFALFNFLIFNSKTREILGKFYKILIVVLYILAALAASTIVFEQGIKDEIQNIWRQKTSCDIRKIKQDVGEIKDNTQDKMNKNIFSHDPLFDITRALIDIKMQLRDRSDYVDLLLGYFEDMAKIPSYPEPKWKETESIIYERYRMIIQNKYDNRKIHVYINGKRETKSVYDVFREERDKFINFKWGKKK